MEINETYARIGEYIKSHPSETYAQIGSTLGLSRGAVARIARLQGIKRRPGKRPSALEAAIAAMEATSPKPDSGSAGGAAAPSPEPDEAETVAASADAAVL